MGKTNLLEKLFSHKNVEDVGEDVKIDKDTKPSGQCSRCLRSSHQSNYCHAKNDIDGNPITAPPTVSLFEINEKSKIEKRQAQKKKIMAKKLQKTKKIPCQNWKEGKCLKAENCSFSHDDPEGFDPRSKQLCHFYKLGSCVKGTLCVFSHCKKDFPCVYFHKKGLSCSYTSDTCEYHHNTLTDKDKLFLDQIEQNYAAKQAQRQSE